MLARTRRWLSVQAKVEVVDKSLVLVKPVRPQDVLVPGAVLQDGQCKATVLFKQHEGVFAYSDCDALRTGQVLTQHKHGVATLQDGKKRVFDTPPRDMDRIPISENWHSGNAAIDMMVPVGKGQSMVFVEPSSPTGRSLFSEVVEAIPECVRIAPETSSRADPDTQWILDCHEACARAEQSRDSLQTQNVLVVDTIEPFQRVWERAELILLNRNPNRSLVDRRKDRTDLRHFYSSLLQRAAKLKVGANHSTTVLVRAWNPTTLEHDQGPCSEPFELSSFETEVREGVRQVDDFERLVKLKARIPSLVLDRATLSKLKITPPGMTKALSARYHQEELYSIADGHVIVSDNHDFPFDIRSSLTRIGVPQDTHHPLVRSLAGGLRIEISDLYDSTEQREQNAVRLAAWKRAFGLCPQSTSCKYQAALAFGVRKGLFDDPSKTPEIDMGTVELLKLEEEASAQQDTLKRCVGL